MNISVVIPLYNKQDTIVRAVESVRKQTVQPLEIVVVNDGSTDGSEEIVRKMNCPGLRLIDQRNAGVSAARNRGWGDARGEWVAFLDADDEWEADYLESLVGLHEKYPGCKVYATSYKFWNENEITLPTIGWQEKEGVLEDYFKVAAHGSPPLWTSAVMVEKEALKNVGGFSSEIKIGEDLLVWAKLASKYKVAYLNEPKAIYYFPTSVNSQTKLRRPDDNDLVYRELVRIYGEEKSAEKRNSIREYIGYWCKIRLHLYSFYREKGRALNEYMKMVKATPFNIKGLVLLIAAYMPKPVHDIVFDSSVNKMR
jgi:glycosyltransferase involved in cell wall biosynthesis